MRKVQSIEYNTEYTLLLIHYCKKCIDRKPVAVNKKKASSSRDHKGEQCEGMMWHILEANTYYCS